MMKRRLFLCLALIILLAAQCAADEAAKKVENNDVDYMFELLKQSLSADVPTGDEVAYRVLASVKKKLVLPQQTASKPELAQKTAVVAKEVKQPEIAEEKGLTGFAALKAEVLRNEASAAEKERQKTAAALKQNKEKSAVKLSDSLLATARQMLGKPYRRGKASPAKGFDCSGFVWWVYKQHGVSVPRSSVSQSKAGVKVPANKMQPGDIVVMKNRRGRDSPNGIHTGIYIGNGKMIHAPRTGKKVSIVKITKYYRVAYGRRILNAK